MRTLKKLFYYFKNLPYFYRYYGPKTFLKKIIEKVLVKYILKTKNIIKKHLKLDFIKNLILNKTILSDFPIVMKKMPLLIYIEVSTYCDMSCIMCGRQYYNISESDQGFISKKVFKNILPIVTKNSMVALFGRGEPLMHKDFIYFVKKLTQREATVLFTTNGKTLTPDIAKELLQSPVYRIVFSCSAGTKSTYEYIHRGNTWDNLWKNISELHKLKVKENWRRNDNILLPIITLEFVAQRKNIKELPLLVERAFDYQLNSILVVSLIAHTKELEEQRMDAPNTIPLAKKYFKLAEEVVKKRKQENPNFKIEFPDFYYLQDKQSALKKDKYTVKKLSPVRLVKIDSIESKNICIEPWHTFYVRFDGTVTTCCVTNRVMGNINQSSAKKIWNGTLYQKFRKRMLSADKPFECQRCHLVMGKTYYDKDLDDLSKYEPL